MIRVLLAGGAGYIGSHTAKCLASHGFEPVTIDNLVTGHAWAVKWGPLITADIADRRIVCELVRQHRIQAVMHFAAYANVAESMSDPRKYFNNNVSSTINFLDALLDCSVKHVIFSSTCATYGLPERIPITEAHAQKPVSPYGESKLMIEKLLRWYGAAYGHSSVCLRYFNAAGADEEGQIGEVHAVETHLIPLAIAAATRESGMLSVYGTDYSTDDGTAIRDYTHVTDLAEAHVKALQYLLDGGGSTALNLGTGTGHSVLEVIRAVESITKLKVPVELAGRRPGDPPVLVADPTLAREVLGWRPRFTDINDIVRTAYNWHISSESLRRPLVDRTEAQKAAPADVLSSS